MARLVDPDELGQGTKTTGISITSFTATGSNVTIAGTSMPVLASLEYFEIRDANSSENNGLYFTTGTPSASSISATKVAGDNGATPITDAAGGQTATFFYTDQSSPATGANQKSVYFDWYGREIWLLKQGSGNANSLTDDGVTLQALYSFTKEEWRLDDDLIKHPFPFIAITPEQFELVEGWIFHKGISTASPPNPVQNTETIKLIRTGGFREIDTNNITQVEYAGIITLGTFENNAQDKAYFELGDDPTVNDTTEFTFAGPVNEAILIYDYMPSALGTVTVSRDTVSPIIGDTIQRSTGNWRTDGYKVGGQITVTASDTAGDLGTYTILAISTTSTTDDTLTLDTNALADDADNTAFASAVNNRNSLKVRIRVRDNLDTNGSTFDSSDLAAIGVTGTIENNVYRFPLGSASDTNIGATDATISAGGVYADIVVRFFDDTFSKEVAAGITSNFSIVVDVGSYSGVDGTTNGSDILSTADAGIPGGYTGGTIVIHEGANKGEYTINSTTAGSVTSTGAAFSVDSGLSFTLLPPTETTATLANVYEKIQYLLRQTTNINSFSGGSTIIGQKADDLLQFVGADLNSGIADPENPANSVVNGVIINGIRETDKNNVAYFDDGGVKRVFPFTATGTITFNSNLVEDIADGAKFWMFFDHTVRTSGTDISVGTPTGRTAVITAASTFDNLSGTSPQHLLDQEYVRFSGFTNPENNGIWRVTDNSGLAASPVQFTAYKVSGDAPIAESAGGSVNLDQNPIDSPAAILVQNADGVDITGTIAGASSSFTFDYDGNTQGGRTASTDADIVLRAIGVDDAQFVEVASIDIKRTNTNNYSLVAPKERNYTT